MSSERTKASVVVRNATLDDVSAIAALVLKVYGRPADGYTPGMLRGQISSFPEGQFLVEYDGEVVGYAASFIVSADLALKPHDWIEITGNGYAARHDPEGDWLYGMEGCVDPEIRRTRIG
ncbi:MAG: carbon-nitrogen hydrolase, partial [Henriciella sp.]|nr:carbon-nitrogen hydrolase [Henriciella sp.]